MNFLRDGNQFDLAILDAQLPGMDGFTLAAEIHQLPNTTTLPLVLLTPLGARLEAPATTPIPFLAFAVKPVKPAQFFETLTRALSDIKPAPPPQRRRHGSGQSNLCQPPAVARIIVRRQRHQSEGCRAHPAATGLRAGPGRQRPGSARRA